MKRLAVFLDGTWNEGNDNTNVWRSHALCDASDGDGVEQLTYYDIGVNGFVGGTFGRGLVDNVLQAYEWLIGNYAPGDELYLFGFSRGAYTARSLAGLIGKYGLLLPGSPISTKQILARYKRAEDATIYKLLDPDGEAERHSTGIGISTEERLLQKYSQRVPIQMVGVWDTVGSLGIPAFGIKGVSRKTLNWLRTGMRQCIRHGFHALAIDEHRKSFIPTLWTYREGIKAKPRPLSSVEQRWFSGAHANVGGGYSQDFLAQPPLQWLIGKAQELGLKMRYSVEIDGDIHGSDIVDSHGDFLWGAYKWFSQPHHRIIDAAPTTDELGNTHHTINETIDVSVFDRWRLRSDYRPPSISEWARVRGIEPAEITTAIQIDGTVI